MERVLIIYCLKRGLKVARRVASEKVEPHTSLVLVVPTSKRTRLRKKARYAGVRSMRTVKEWVSVSPVNDSLTLLTRRCIKKRARK